MAYYSKIVEEELKNKVGKEWFSKFDTTQIIGKIDFCVAIPIGDGPQLFETESLLWAEAKQGTSHDIWESFVQLILTIGRAQTHADHLPPAFLGAFDAEKIAFIPFDAILEVFYINDFNWNVTPSDHSTKEFKLLYSKVKDELHEKSIIYNFETDGKELQHFIRHNFIVGKSHQTRVRINKNNFTNIYQKWRQRVKPTIAVDWEAVKKDGIIDADFYLADILSEDNLTLREKLYVILKGNTYKLDHFVNKNTGLAYDSYVDFNDGQIAHRDFWKHYNRPPKREYWDYIVERRDLLVPQDVRERKGSYFTPSQWVQLSQEYLATELGENWQEEYVIWDCAAGTGNLLAGLTNKYNIWASTIDKADVDVMHDRIKRMNESSSNGDGANLLESHVFQFDFLNDPFSNLPEGLQQIVNDPERRKKLVIYINPPYKEAPKYGQEGAVDVQATMVNRKYKALLKQGNRELFAQFFTRIYIEIPSCILAAFSTLKILQGPHFVDFRHFFCAKLGRFFVVPADTFDNVTGKFPIGFMIWHTDTKEPFNSCIADVYDKNGEIIGKKTFQAYDESHYMNEWIKPYRAIKGKSKIIGKFPFKGNDFQNQNMVQIVHQEMEYNKAAGQFLIDRENLNKACVYFAARKGVPANWLNDRDQFLAPKDNEWEYDFEFQTNCIIYTLFSHNVISKYGTNHWIPFTENEINAQNNLESNFMSNYLRGIVEKEKKDAEEQSLFAGQQGLPFIPLEHLSDEARKTFEAGRELWRYYHKQPDANPNASLYDIRLYFQGMKVTKNGKEQMNSESDDKQYMHLIGQLRQSLKELTLAIRPKVYDYGFLIK